MQGNDKVRPCLPCGYEGPLDGRYNGFWHELKCPRCGNLVQGFTAEGMLEKWQAENTPKEVDDGV